MVKAESETMTQSLSKLMKAYETVGQTEAVKSSMFIRAFNAGKEALKNGSKKLFSGEIDTTVKAMAAEGLEEVSEEAMQDGWKGVYNTLNQVPIRYARYCIKIWNEFIWWCTRWSCFSFK